MKITKDQNKWVIKAIKGDEKAFCVLFKAYQGPVYNFIYRMVGNAEEASDATQNVFFKMYKKINTLKNSKYFSTWLFSIAKNEALSMLYKSKHKNSNQELPEDIPDNIAQQPLNDLVYKEFETIFQQILLELPDMYRMAFILGVLERKPYGKVAKIMNCTVSNVKLRIFRARSMIVKRLLAIYEHKKWDITWIVKK